MEHQSSDSKFDEWSQAKSLTQKHCYVRKVLGMDDTVLNHRLTIGSIPAQTREAEDYCRQRDWKIARVYSEEGISAHSDSIAKRPEFRRLLQDCNKGEFDVVIVHSLDRWSRNLRVILESFKQLADRGIAFVSITENIDYSTPERKLFIAMLGAFAQYFSDSLSKHTTKGMKQRALNGLHNGDVPFGYERCSENCPPEHKARVHNCSKRG